MSLRVNRSGLAFGTRKQGNRSMYRVFANTLRFFWDNIENDLGCFHSPGLCCIIIVFGQG